MNTLGVELDEESIFIIKKRRKKYFFGAEYKYFVACDVVTSKTKSMAKSQEQCLEQR